MCNKKKNGAVAKNNLFKMSFISNQATRPTKTNARQILANQQEFSSDNTFVPVKHKRNDFLIALLIIASIITVWIIYNMLSKPSPTPQSSSERVMGPQNANPYYTGTNPCTSCEKPLTLWPANVPVQIDDNRIADTTTGDHFYEASHLNL